MSDELRDAAEKYAQCRHLQNRESIEAQRAFQKGAGWALRNLRWIPITEKWPEQRGRYLVLVKSAFDESINLFMGIFIPGDEESLHNHFLGFKNTLAWCPIPEQLLNFKLPAEEAGKDAEK